MLGCSWSFFPNVSGLTLQQQSYKYISPCKVCVRHERKKWTLSKICSLRGLEEMQVRDKRHRWLVPSWTVRRISRCLLCVFSLLSIIPWSRTLLIEWPAMLQCSTKGKPSKFFLMLQRCLPKRCLSSFLHHYFNFLLNILVLTFWSVTQLISIFFRCYLFEIVDTCTNFTYI